MPSLIRFAIKNTRSGSGSSDKLVSHARSVPEGVADALSAIRSARSPVSGIPDDIDHPPLASDYPSVDLSETMWDDASSQTLADLANAPWKCVGVSATTTSIFSKPVQFTLTDEGAGWRGTPRIRAIAVVWVRNQEVVTHAWDVDAINRNQRAELLAAVLSHVVIGFDTARILSLINGQYQAIVQKPAPEPERVIDLLLVSRVLRPTIPMELQVKSKDSDSCRDIVGDGGSGWTLAGISAIALGEPLASSDLDSRRQWCAPAPLGDAYCQRLCEETALPHRILIALLKKPSDVGLLQAWDQFIAKQLNADRQRLKEMEVFPLSLAQMHQKGFPWSGEAQSSYVDALKKEIDQQIEELIKAEPALQPFKEDFCDSSKGIGNEMKAELAHAFESRGLAVEYTKAKPVLPKIGEKALRGAGATQSDAIKPLFEALVRITRAKKRIEMSEKLSEFALRSGDGGLHSMFSPTTGTLRLTSKEPNCQQLPGDQQFRDQVEAPEGFSLVSCDYNALDVRVGAALAIRAQRAWVKALQSNNFSDLTKDGALIEYIQKALKSANPRADQNGLERRLGYIKSQARDRRSWGQFDDTKKQILAFRAAAAWNVIRLKVSDSHDGTWGALREAFQLDADIHTYTTLRFAGKDPSALLKSDIGDNSTPESRQAWWDAQRLEVGGDRKRGKIANLELLYAMTAESFQEDAAKKFDEHWTIKEARQIRSDWYDAFPEIELMNCITEMNAITSDHQGNRLIGYRLKDEGKGKSRPLTIYRCQTLSGRVLYAEGMHAGINYSNQGTGADILMSAMTALRQQHRRSHDMIVNQIHDELVAKVPDEEATQQAELLTDVMTEAARSLTEPFGVPMKVTHSLGKVWIKD